MKQWQVLVFACRDGVEFVADVVTRRHIFGPGETKLNIDDILPYEELNVSALCWILAVNMLKLATQHVGPGIYTTQPQLTYANTIFS